MVNKEKRCTFSKEERLSWKRHIDLLFEKGQSFVAFPLRVVYLFIDKEIEIEASTSTILVSVSKKRIKRAVKRNLIKRQVREIYRVRKHDLQDSLRQKGKTILLAILYIDKEIKPFSDMEKAMTKVIKTLQNQE